MWFGTDDGLLGMKYSSSDAFVISNLNNRSNELEIIENNKCDPYAIANSLVNNPFVDSHGNLWLGTYTNRVIKYTPQTNKFRHFYNVPDNPKSLGSHNVFGFTEEKSGNILIAMDDREIGRASCRERV